MITVPEEFSRRRSRVSGAAGRAWIDALPSTIERLCERWRLTIDGLPSCGEVGLAVPVARGDERLILKVSWTDGDSEHEAFALCVWNGRGAVRVLEHDEHDWALLLERLDANRSLRTLAFHDAVAVAASLLRRLAVPSPVGPPTQVDTVARIRQAIVDERERSARGLPPDLLDLAVDCIDDGVIGTTVLVNTDLHYDNVLAGVREPWLAIDPKVVIGAVEYGIAPLLWNLREQFAETSPHRLLGMIVTAGNFDPEEARRWTIVRTIDYWLWAVRTGLTNDPQMCHSIITSIR